MKKIMFAALAVLLTAPAFCGIEAGDNHIFIFGGKAVTLDSRFEYSGGQNLRVLYDGFGFGAQYLHYVNPYIGLGVELSGVNYGSFRDSLYLGNNTAADIDTRAERYDLLFLFKVNVNPADRLRLYPVLGFGLNWFKYKSQITATNFTLSLTAHETVKNNDFLPGGYLGLGLEGDIAGPVTIGLEGRYNAFMFSKGREETTNSFLTDFSVLLKLGVKF